jgi:hypothetical protein
MAEKIKFMMLKDYKLAEKLSPIFTEILKERINQDKKWGEQNHPMVRTKKIIKSLKNEAGIFKNQNNTDSKNGKCSWYNIFMEEFLEAFSETTPEKQREEMIQVAAVAIAIIECLDRKIERD